MATLNYNERQQFIKANPQVNHVLSRTNMAETSNKKKGH